MEYARRGWPVFACWGVEPDGRCGCRTPECHATGKHPIWVGSTGATLDGHLIEKWWSERPSANVAIRTGDGLAVVDLDLKPERDGFQSWASLQDYHGKAPPTVTSVTGSGGRHLFFRVGVEVRNYQAGERLGPGIDVRGTHGYIIAPPSRHRSGNPYRWLDGHSPEDVEVAEAPAWLVELMTRPAERPMRAPSHQMPAGSASRVRDVGTRSAPASNNIPDVIPHGTRNRTLFSLAGTLGNKGLTSEEIVEMLLPVNEMRCEPPLEESEVVTVARSAARYAIHASDPGVLTPVARSGRRFRDMSSLAGALAWRGLTAEEIGFAMRVLNVYRCDPELDDDEMALLLTDILKRREFER